MADPRLLRDAEHDSYSLTDVVDSLPVVLLTELANDFRPLITNELVERPSHVHSECPYD